MEFPDLGQHCSAKTCNRLDFLPMKCDACSQILCKDHIQYASHQCEKGYQKDNQVPICPLCNQPVPVKPGEPPDIGVGQHIDRDCRSDKRKVYTNKCSMKGCKQKEMVPISCAQCKLNYCLKHRHTHDHDCQGIIQNTTATSGYGRTGRTNMTNTASNRQGSRNARTTGDMMSSVQGGLTEDEALALALQKSLADEDNSQRNRQWERNQQLGSMFTERQRSRSQRNCIVS